MSRAAVCALLALLVIAAVAVDAKPTRMTRRRAASAPRVRDPSWGNYSNPVLWNDLADIDIFRVNDTYYYSASTMHYSPGAPILRSYDLVNWEYVGHSVPSLDFGSSFDLANGTRAYVNGVWASYLTYRKSNGLFYWGGCIHNGPGTFIYSAPAITGPWTKHGPIQCFYDAGVLVDDDDTMYVAFGTTNINVAQLTEDGYNVVKTQQVLSASVYIEGSRLYKRNGYYYLWNTQPSNAQWVARATSVWGPYTQKQVLNNMNPPVPNAGIPHQGGLVSTPNDDWYYMAFIDNYPGGRTPVLAPIQWVDDWPVIVTVNNGWGASYPYPVAPHPMPPVTGTELFESETLGPQWEWNHNPDNSKWTAGTPGLTLQTATVTSDIYQARNTLTHRILGPKSNGTIVMDITGMTNGDRAGLALFRDQSAYIGVWKQNGAAQLVFVNNITMSTSWTTTNTGVLAKSLALDAAQTSVTLCLAVDIHPGTGRLGTFWYSLDDGASFTQLGEYTMTNSWNFFMGYRYGIFNFATTALGGEVFVEEFTLQAM